MSKKNDRKKKKRRMAGRCPDCKGTCMGPDGYRCERCGGSGKVTDERPRHEAAD